MPLFLNGVFALELALLFTHEMDAVRRREWNMFAALKHREDEQAFQIFMLLHIPLYASVLWLLLSPWSLAVYYFADIFLIVHPFVHFAFRKHPANEMNGPLSLFLIWAPGLLACVHLACLPLWA